MADNIQTNVIDGDFVAVSSSNLALKEGFAAVLVDFAGAAKVTLATADQLAIGVILDGGAASGDNCVIRPFRPGRQVRVVSGAAIAASGTKISVDGTARAITAPIAGAGKFGIGVGMERAAAAGEYTLIMPIMGLSNNA